ncbi:hypothetical protein [Plesiomonas shigelloides]|nr:hypothetical protein [Plesiomonas shigelloides]MCQ8859009.1 hypothetical protein [Plesiomonas shigelloides]
MQKKALKRIKRETKGKGKGKTVAQEISSAIPRQQQPTFGRHHR